MKSNGNKKQITDMYLLIQIISFKLIL